MTYPLAMARAFQGEPWRCLVVEITDKAAYLTAPERATEVEAGACEPVAFPLEDVFEFDGGIFGHLEQQWRNAHRTDDSIWQSATPFGTKRAA